MALEKVNIEGQLQSLKASLLESEYDILLKSLNIIFQHVTTINQAFILEENFTSFLELLLTQSSFKIPACNWNDALVSCATVSFRICRNACAKFVENQTILKQKRVLLNSTKDLLVHLASCDSLSEELLVLARCAVQFVGNFCTGNVENEIVVVDLFFHVFRSLLQIEDEKLQQYVCIVIHTCLSGCLASPEAHRRIVDRADCWTVLLAVIKLCVDREAPWGLYVIEDACMYSKFCDNVYTSLNAQERILVLEVLANHLKSVTEEELGTKTPKLPDIGNLQHLSDHCKSSATRILDMHTRGGQEDQETMVTVKELECLSLATAQHKSCSPLQEDTELLKCCIGLLQKIDDLGRQGNSIFSSIEKISQEGAVDPHHPVFGLKRDLIRLIGNLSYHHRVNQDLVRELEGLPVILSQTNIDGKNPFIKQWSLFAIHNLTENNDKNKLYIADLKMQGVTNNQAVLEDLGLEVRADGDRITVKKLKR